MQPNDFYNPYPRNFNFTPNAHYKDYYSVNISFSFGCMIVAKLMTKKQFDYAMTKSINFFEDLGEMI